MNKHFLCLSLLLSLLLFPFIKEPNYKQTSATDVGSETYKTLMVSSNNYPVNYLYVSLDNFQTEIEMKMIQKYNNYSLFIAYLPSSKLPSDNGTIYFRDNNYSINALYRTSTMFYNYTSNNYIGPNNGTFALASSTIQSSYTSRRLWFTLSSEQNAFIGLYSSNVRYMLTRISNRVDNRYYYYADVPVNNNKFTIQCITDYINNTKYNIGSERTYFEAEMHRINYIDTSSSSISKYEPIGLDSEFINEYLKGFSSCLDSSKNGYLAYSPYISEMMSYYHLDLSNLDNVYQDDYQSSDYDDGYKNTSIRGGQTISALDKLNEIASNYASKNNRIINNIDVSSDKTISLIIISIIIVGTFTGYIYYRYKKVSHR